MDKQNHRRADNSSLNNHHKISPQSALNCFVQKTERESHCTPVISLHNKEAQQLSGN